MVLVPSVEKAYSILIRDENRRKFILILLFSPLIRYHVLQAPVLIPGLLHLLTDLSIRWWTLIPNEMIMSANIAKRLVILLISVLYFMASHLSLSSPRVNGLLHVLKWRILPILPHLILLRLIHLHVVFLRNNMIISWSSSIMFRSLPQVQDHPHMLMPIFASWHSIPGYKSSGHTVCHASVEDFSSSILDSGATNYMTPHKHLLHNIQHLLSPCLFTLPNGYKVRVTFFGSLFLFSNITLHNVLLVCSFHYNLISIH